MEDGFDDMSSFALMTLDERLIELVRSHKIIYNKQCFGHRGLEQKQAAWNAIGEQLDTTAEECAKRWTSLRERYSRELRRLEKLSEKNLSSQELLEVLAMRRWVGTLLHHRKSLKCFLLKVMNFPTQATLLHHQQSTKALVLKVMNFPTQATLLQHKKSSKS
ncbi:PREDICTED: transcription factor Adf-1-like isoform X4 [Rhagoletis zephyria]|uniref:transcription factor Adf-1-like isoform X4 n=1 Tax=Rhagoletis zephyria TaxID=28612 RepID=UPI0008119B8E|nr:PREDICTED: transcription factor Adf-1-like isoform X4 [Rhagoletis zephyria]